MLLFFKLSSIPLIACRVSIVRRCITELPRSSLMSSCMLVAAPGSQGLWLTVGQREVFLETTSAGRGSAITAYGVEGLGSIFDLMVAVVGLLGSFAGFAFYTG